MLEVAWDGQLQWLRDDYEMTGAHEKRDKRSSYSVRATCSLRQRFVSEDIVCCVVEQSLRWRMQGILKVNLLEDHIKVSVEVVCFPIVVHTLCVRDGASMQHR